MGANSSLSWGPGYTECRTWKGWKYQILSLSHTLLARLAFRNSRRKSQSWTLSGRGSGQGIVKKVGIDRGGWEKCLKSGGKQMSPMSPRKAGDRTWGTTGWSAFIPGKVIPETISSHIKNEKVIKSSQCGFTKVKSWIDEHRVRQIENWMNGFPQRWWTLA